MAICFLKLHFCIQLSCLYINKINAFDIRNNAFMHCDSLSEIKISALNFGKFSFGYCKSLKKVLFDRVIVTYGAYMFSNCQLELQKKIKNLLYILLFLYKF